MSLWEHKVSRNSKSVSLLMHASVTSCISEKKSLFLSSGALSHFCLSDFCFFISLHRGYGKRTFFCSRNF